MTERGVWAGQKIRSFELRTCRGLGGTCQSHWLLFFLLGWEVGGYPMRETLERRDYFGSQLKDQVHHGRDITVAGGAQGGRSHFIHSQEAKRNAFWDSADLLCYLAHWDGVIHNCGTGGFPPQINSNKLGHPRACQVGSIDHDAELPQKK